MPDANTNYAGTGFDHFEHQYSTQLPPTLLADNATFEYGGRGFSGPFHLLQGHSVADGFHLGSRQPGTEPNQNRVAELHPHYHTPDVAYGGDAWGHTDAPLSYLVGTAGGKVTARVSVESPPMGANNIGIRNPKKKRATTPYMKYQGKRTQRQKPQHPDACEQTQVSIVAINPTQNQTTNACVGDPRYSIAHTTSHTLGSSQSGTDQVQMRKRAGGLETSAFDRFHCPGPGRDKLD